MNRGMEYKAGKKKIKQRWVGIGEKKVEKKRKRRKKGKRKRLE